MTIQQLIDYLLTIEDKSLPIYFEEVSTRNFYHEITEANVGQTEHRNPITCIVLESY